MAQIGYARVSIRSQKDDSQVDDLIASGLRQDLHRRRFR